MSFSEMLNYKIQLFKSAEFEMDLEWKSRFEKKTKIIKRNNHWFKVLSETSKQWLKTYSFLVLEYIWV